MMKLGLIGCGKMGGALLRGVEQALGKASLNVALSDVMPEAVSSLQKCLACKSITGTPAEVAAASEVIILAVKPGDVKPLCEALAQVNGSRRRHQLDRENASKIRDRRAQLPAGVPPHRHVIFLHC